MTWDDLAAKVQASEAIGRPYVFSPLNRDVHLLIYWTADGKEEHEQILTKDVQALTEALRERGIELQRTPGS